jgi:hypothetical protein
MYTTLLVSNLKGGNSAFLKGIFIPLQDNENMAKRCYAVPGHFTGLLGVYIARLS